MSALELASLARQHGDGKTINYRNFLQSNGLAATSAQSSRLPTTPHSGRFPSAAAAQQSGPGRPTSPRRPQSPGTAGPIARVHDFAPEDATQSRFLKFESDSNAYSRYHRGDPAVLLAHPSSNSFSSKKTDYKQREENYSLNRAAVVGSSVEAAHPETAEGSTRRRSSILSGSRLDFAANGAIENSGSLSKYLESTSSAEAIGPGYLPPFPGEAHPKRAHHDPIEHTGKIVAAGGIIGFMDSPADIREGYLPALPNDANQLPRPAVHDPLNHSGSLVGKGSAGIGAWGGDVEYMASETQRLQTQVHDPLHHNGELRTHGGLTGLATSQRNWLQDVPLTPALQLTATPPGHGSSSRSKSASRAAGKRQTPRRRSVPDLLAGNYQAAQQRPDDNVDVEAELDALDGRDNDHEDGNDDGGAASSSSYMSGIDRSNRTMFTSQLHGDVAGPLTYNSGVQHEKLSRSLGLRSPVAVAMAAGPMGAFDTRKLALVRKHIREALPSKTTAAIASLRHSLANKDGDKDGRLTDSELMSGLTEMMPSLGADEVGMVIRYLRQRNAKRQAAEKEFAASAPGVATSSSSSAAAATGGKIGSIAQASSEEVSQAAVSTAHFGEGIDVEELASWVAMQPGGREQVANPMYALGPSTFTSHVNATGSSPPLLDGHGAAGSSPSRHAGRRLASPIHPEDSPCETREHGRLAHDSTHARAAMVQDEAAPFSGRRGSVTAAELENRPAHVDDDVRSLISSYTLTSGLGSGSNKKPLTYHEYHRMRRMANADYTSGDAAAPPAGALSGDRKQHKAASGDGADGSGKTTDRTEWAEKNARFEKFRADWEGKHGAAARKEMKADLAEPVEGPTWTRAEPVPFKVLHLKLASPPPTPGRGTATTKPHLQL